MTLSEIRTEVFRRLRESLSSPVYWSEADVDVSINEGYAEMADASEFYELYQTVDILKSRPYYDCRTLIRNDFLVAGPAFNATTNRWLIPIQAQDLDSSEDRWERRAAEPEFMMVRGIWWVSYWPWKSSESGSIKQYYVSLPPALSDDGDSPLFSPLFHYGLVEYALWDLFSQDDEVDLAWEAWRRYQQYEASLVAYMDGRAAVPALHGAAPAV